jgi:hypothetical protein
MKTKPTATQEFESHYGVKFLKTQSEQTTAERIVTFALYEFTDWRDINYNQTYSITRSAACIEAVLLMEGVLKLGQEFERKVTKSKFLFCTWEVETKETYREMMQRMGLEYLKEQGVIG